MYLLKPELLPTRFLSLPGSSRHRAVPLHPELGSRGTLQALGCAFGDVGCGRQGQDEDTPVGCGEALGRPRAVSSAHS